MNWYIGQDIVAVRDHSNGRFKRGDEFKIKGLKEGLCACGDNGNILIDIGLNDPKLKGTRCFKCGISSNGFWYKEGWFTPLDPIKEAISELMEQTQVAPVLVPHTIEI